MSEWPSEIRLSPDKKTLTIRYADGRSHALSAEFLRVLSPSAEVQGHGEADRKTVGGKRNVEILSLDPVGNYALRITFDDMHDTGLYTWTYLAELGDHAEERWQGYLGELSAKGLTRDRPGMK